MEKKNKIKTPDSKGAAIFKRMLDDKKAIHNHLAKGGSFSELKKKGFKFATGLSGR